MRTTTLYWIHLPEHTDIFTQGYVGVTSNFKHRKSEHKHGNSPVLKNAGVTWDQVVVDTWEIPFDTHRIMENGLRPDISIGWNTDIGGTGAGKKIGGKGAAGDKLTDEQKAAIVIQYAAGGISQAKIAKQYGVIRESIKYIVNVWARKNKVFA